MPCMNRSYTKRQTIYFVCSLRYYEHGIVSISLLSSGSIPTLTDSMREHCEHSEIPNKKFSCRRKKHALLFRNIFMLAWSQIKASFSGEGLGLWRLDSCRPRAPRIQFFFYCNTLNINFAIPQMQMSHIGMMLCNSVS